MADKRTGILSRLKGLSTGGFRLLIDILIALKALFVDAPWWFVRNIKSVFLDTLSALKMLLVDPPLWFVRNLKGWLLNTLSALKMLLVDAPLWFLRNLKGRFLDALRLVSDALRLVATGLRALFVNARRWLVANSRRLFISAITSPLIALRRLLLGILTLLVGGLNRVLRRGKVATEAAMLKEVGVIPLTPEVGVIPLTPVAELESYPVNEPYAYIAIEDRQPPRYVVKEPPLTEGEQELLKEIKARLYESLDIRFHDGDAAGYLRQAVDTALTDFRLDLTAEDKEKIMYYVTRDLLGYEKLDAILRDRQVEDISADGPDIPLYVYHRRYGSVESNVVFQQEELDSLIYKLAQRSGRHISLSRPLLDASLPTKDRLQLSIGAEITTRGSTFTIRKFRETPFTPLDLINYGTISLEIAAYFWMAVENGFNFLISGTTASGKTSTLNALAMFIPRTSKIVTIEDTREINLLHQNWIPSVTREGVSKGYAIEMFDLLRAALRQRPEYLLVGEVRGREANILFQAMATGHIVISTVHADSVDAIVRRLTKPPIDVPLMLLDSLDVVALQAMVKVGDRRVRRCTSVVEITGVDFSNERLETNQVFSWKPDEFTFTGESRLFLEMMNKLSLNEQQLADEFARRVEILRILRTKGSSDFHELSQLFFDYSVNPAAVESKLKEGAQP